jgi:hypothetical protein
MTALSPETRRLLQLSRSGDDPTRAREQAVRKRLVAQLGVTALAGVATASAALGGAEAAGAASASTLAGSAPAGGVVGTAANAVSVGATALTKTVATLVLAAGLGAGVWKSDDVVEQGVGWTATITVEAKQVARRAWHVLTGAEGSGARSDNTHLPTIESPTSVEPIHERLVAVARRPNRPVAKETELVLILAAEQALEAGDHERASRYLDQHEARFAAGAMKQDREVLRVLCERARHGAGDTPPLAPPTHSPFRAGSTNF